MFFHRVIIAQLKVILLKEKNMIQKIYFKNIPDLYVVCQEAGFLGTYEEFLNLNIGQVFAYINILTFGSKVEN